MFLPDTRDTLIRGVSVPYSETHVVGEQGIGAISQVTTQSTAYALRIHATTPWCVNRLCTYLMVAANAASFRADLRQDDRSTRPPQGGFRIDAADGPNTDSPR